MSFLKSIAFLVATTLMVSSGSGNARDGDLLPRFGSDGVSVQGPIAGTAYSVMSINHTIELSDGRILAASTVSASGSIYAAVIRLSADGILDPAFGDHGAFVVPITSADPGGGEGLDLIQSGGGRFILVGRALAGGATPLKYSRSCTLLAAFDADGQPDPAFGGAGANGSICFAFGSPDPVYLSSHVGSGLPAAGGGFYISGPNSVNDMIGVARLTAGGVLDSSFGTNGVCYLDDTRGSGLLRRDLQGRLIVAGVVAAQTPAPPEGQPLGAMRIDDDCAYDPTYVPHAKIETAGTASQELIDAAVDSQGRLLLAIRDYVSAPAEAAHAFVLARFRADGTLDDAFNPAEQQPGSPGIAKLPIGSGIAFGDSSGDSITGVLPTDRGTYVSGFVFGASPLSIVLARVLEDGAFDYTFGNPSTPGVSSFSFGGGATARGGITSASQGSLLLQGSGANPICGVVLRVSIDSLFADGFEPVVAPACPASSQVRLRVR